MRTARLRARCTLAVHHFSQDIKEATTPRWFVQHLHRNSPGTLPPCPFVSSRCRFRITTHLPVPRAPRAGRHSCMRCASWMCSDALASGEAPRVVIGFPSQLSIADLHRLARTQCPYSWLPHGPVVRLTTHRAARFPSRWHSCAVRQPTSSLSCASWSFRPQDAAACSAWVVLWGRIGAMWGCACLWGAPREALVHRTGMHWRECGAHHRVVAHPHLRGTGA